MNGVPAGDISARIGLADGEGKPFHRPHFHRPLLPVALTYGMGVLAGPWLPFKPLVLLAGVFLLAGAGGLALAARRRGLATMLILLGFFLFGLLRFLHGVFPRGRFHLSRIPEAWLTEKVQLEGSIVSPPELFPPGAGWRQQERVRFLMQARTITIAGVQFPATGGARLSIIGPVKEYRYGHRIRGRFRLRRPRGYWNPGAFNYTRYALMRGFVLEGWGQGGEAVLILDRTGGNRILQVVADLRETMLHHMHNRFAGEEGGMLRALVLGDRSDLAPKVQEAFLASGTFHILVISGLHVGFLAGLLFFGGRSLHLAVSTSSLVAVLGVVLYALLTGGSPPIIRAALMTCLYLLALILGRPRDLANALALAAFLLLLWNPLYLFDAGFQLTFMATGAILIVLGRWNLDHLSRLTRWVVASLLASTAATVGTAPLLAFHFNRVSIIGILANLLMVPLGGCLTAVGMLYSLFLLLFPQGLSLIEGVVFFLVRGMIGVATAFSVLPLASVRLYTPSLPMLLTGYTLFAMMVLPRVRRRGIALAVTAGLLLGEIGWRFVPFERQGIEAAFLDVGQGDAILLTLPGRRTMLVDGGGSLDDQFDIGERVVAPYLWYRWIRRLDIVVLSHPQPDHLGGLRAVLENFPVGEVWEAGYPSTAAVYRWIQDFVHKEGIPLRRVRRGERIPVGEVMVTVLHPPHPFLVHPRGHQSAMVNNNSLVLRINHPTFGFLLTGDIEKEGEAALLESGVGLQADLLKVPHHGSRGSSSVPFLQRVSPRWAVIQAGERNPFGHPHAETLARYAAQGVQVFRTDRDGAVTFTVRDGAMAVKTYREDLGIWAGNVYARSGTVKGLTRQEGYVK